MSKDILLRLEGQDHASDLRDQFLGGYDNKTRESIIIDVEMTTIPVLLGVCFLVGIIGNGALFYTICKAKKFRNVPNSFLLNIAVTNTIMLIICPPMIATSYVLGMRWPFGGVACKLVHSIPQATLAISMFSLLALSIERYGAFAAPPKHRGSAKNRACVGNLVIWIIGCLCGLPMAMFAKEQSFFIDGEADKTIKCGVFDKQLWSALYPKIHTTVSICFLFVLPLILCLIFYMSLSCVVCAKKQREGKREEDNSPLRNGGRSSRSGTLTKTSSHTKTNTIRTIDSRTSVPTLKRAVRRRRTMAKVSILLMLQFTILWAPRLTYTVWYYYLYDRETLLWYLMDLIGLVCIYLNAALTPFTIVMFNRGFRHQLGKYLCCCCSCLHCCTCFEKEEKLDSPLPSTSDVSVKASPKRKRCCVSCCSPQTHSDQDSDSESQSTRDAVDKSGYKQNPDLTNLYQELPGQNFYDSYTIPPSNIGEAHHSAVYSAPNRAPGYRPYGAPYGASYRVPYDAVRPVESGVYYPSSYHGDERTHPLPYDGPAYGYDEAPGAPQLLSYHPIYGGAELEPRYISEPQLHAQAPKYSKIMPSRPIRVGQATSIREIPAM